MSEYREGDILGLTVLGGTLGDVAEAAYKELKRRGDEIERLRKRIGNEMNATTLIAHALDDGHIDERVRDLFEDALAEMNAAIDATFREAPSDATD